MPDIEAQGHVHLADHLRKVSDLMEAITLMDEDMHRVGARPCRTCTEISALRGRPFGCDRYSRANDQMKKDAAKYG